MALGPQEPPGAARGAAPGTLLVAQCPPPAVLWAPGVFGENIILVNFLEFSVKVDFCKKIDTKGNSAENSVSPC